MLSYHPCDILHFFIWYFNDEQKSSFDFSTSSKKKVVISGREFLSSEGGTAVECIETMACLDALRKGWAAP